MMQKLFMSVVTMSLTAIPIIIVVLLARMVLKRAPKIISYALWLVVLFRLLCPVSFEAPYSFVPEQIVSGEVTASLTSWYMDDSQMNDDEIIADETPSTNVKERSSISIVNVVWVGGILLFALYSLVLLLKLKRQLVSSIPYKGNVYLSDYIDFPFVLGIVKPKIYLPSTMPESEYAHTILHEMYHIARKDHVVKGIAFAALCIHWFNPLVWIAFILAMSDMEMSCDEAILNQAGEGVKAEYSLSLLGFAGGKRYLPVTFLAFGEVSPKARIKNVLKWKKSSVVWRVGATVVAILIGVICLSNPMEEKVLAGVDELRYEEMTEAEAYEMLTERYFLRPVEFGYLPDGLELEYVEMNLKDRYTKLHYEKSEYVWLDLYVAERYMTTNPQFYMQADEVMYHTLSSDEKASYEVDSNGQRLIQVRVYQSRISEASVMESYFMGLQREEYIIQSYNISQEEYIRMIENLKFEE